MYREFTVVACHGLTSATARRALPWIDPFDLCGTENISPAAIYLDHHGFEARKLNFPCNLCLRSS